VFNHERRRSPFADFIDWTDYRFDGPMRHRPSFARAGRRRHPFVRILILLAIIWVVTRIIRGRRSSNWL